MQNINKIGEKALVAISLRKYKLAIKLAENILKQNPCNDYPYFIIARAYMEMNKLQQAEKAIKLALIYAPNDEVEIATYANILYLKQQYTQALSIADNALTIDPKNETALFVKIASLKMLKKYKSAEELAKHALTLYPNLSELYLLLAEIYVNTNRYQLAEKSYAESLRLNPNDAITLNNLGVYYHDYKQQDKKAIELFQNSLRINPDDKIVISNYNSCKQSINSFFYKLPFSNNSKDDLSGEDIYHGILAFIIFIILRLNEPYISLCIAIIALIYYIVKTLFINLPKN